MTQGKFTLSMVTDDGAVVLQDSYRQVADEVELVLRLKELLLDGIYEVQEITGKRKTR